MGDGRTNKPQANHTSESSLKAGKPQIPAQVLAEPVLRVLGVEPSYKRYLITATDAFESDPGEPAAHFLLKRISGCIKLLAKKQEETTCIEENIERLTCAVSNVHDREERESSAEEVADMLMEISRELADGLGENIAAKASLLVPLFSNERLGGYIDASVSGFESDPAGCEAAQHLMSAAGYAAHTSDIKIIENAIRRILNSVEETDDPELKNAAAINAAQGLVHIAAVVVDERLKEERTEFIQEELRSNPDMKDGVIGFLEQYEHDPEHDETGVCILEVAFDILQPGREELLEIFKFESPHVKLIAERRLKETEEKNRQRFVQEFGFTVFGKIVSTAELFDLSGRELPDAGYYDLDRVMSKEWRGEFLKVMANRPDQPRGDRMLRMLLTDAIGTHIDPERIDGCLSLLEDAFKNTTPTGAKTIALTMAALVSKLEPGPLKARLDARIQPVLESQKVTIKELHVQLKDLAMFESLFITMFDALPGEDFNQVAEAQRQLKEKEAAEQKFSWYFMLRENRHLIRIDCDESKVSILALGDVAVELITGGREGPADHEDGARILDADEALQCMRERFGTECVSFIDHEDGEKTRHLIYRPFDEEKAGELSRFYAATIRVDRVEELHSRSVANFRDQPASRLDETVIDRIAKSELNIRLRRLMREDPESEEARAMIQVLLKQAVSSGAASENVDHALSSFSQAFRGASPRGQEKLAIAVAFLYQRIQDEGIKRAYAERAETLLSAVEHPKTFLRYVEEQTTMTDIHETLRGFLRKPLEAEEERTPEEKAEEFGDALKEFRILAAANNLYCTFDQIFDLASQLRARPSEEGLTPLERSVIRLDNAYTEIDDDLLRREAAKEIISYSIKMFENDAASPDAEINLGTICSQAALIEDSEYLRQTVGELLVSVGLQDDKEAAAVKVARCMIDLAAEVKADLADEVSVCIRANLPRLSATTRRKMIDMLASSGCEHDSPDKRDLLVFELAEPTNKELEKIYGSEEASEYVRQIASEKLDELWIAEFSKVMREKPGSEKAGSMLSALVQVTAEDQSEERLVSTISILTDALEGTGEAGVLQIARTAATVHSQLGDRDLRRQLSDGLGKSLVDGHCEAIVSLLKDADGSEADVLDGLLERHLPFERRTEIRSARDERRNAALSEAEIGPGNIGEGIEKAVAKLQIVSEEPPKPVDFDLTDPRFETSEYTIFVALEKFVAGPDGPDALENLEQVAQNITRVDNQETVNSMINRMLDAANEAPEETKPVVCENVARGLLGIAESLNPQLRDDTILSIQRSIECSDELRGAMLRVLESAEPTDGPGKELLVFSLVELKSKELDDLRKENPNQHVREAADLQWKEQFLGLMREDPGSKEARALLTYLLGLSKDPEELERVKLLLIDAFEQTTDEGKSKIALTAAFIHAGLVADSQPVFSEEVGGVLAGYPDLMKSLLVRLKDRRYYALLGIMGSHFSSEELEEIRSERARVKEAGAAERKWVEGEHPLVDGAPPDASEATDPNIDMEAVMAGHRKMSRVAEPVLDEGLVDSEERTFYDRLAFFSGNPGLKDVKQRLESGVNRLANPETRLEAVTGAANAIIRRAGEFEDGHIVEARQVAFSAIFGIVFKSRREAVDTGLDAKLKQIWDSLSDEEQDALLKHYYAVLLKVPEKAKGETRQQAAKREEREERGIYIYKFLRKKGYVPEGHKMHARLAKHAANDRIRSEAEKVRSGQVTRVHVIENTGQSAQPAVSGEQAVIVNPSLKLDYLLPFENTIAQKAIECGAHHITDEDLKIAIDRMLRRYGEVTGDLTKEARKWIRNSRFVGLAADLYSISREEDPSNRADLVAALRSTRIRNKKLEKMVDHCLRNMGAIPGEGG